MNEQLSVESTEAEFESDIAAALLAAEIAHNGGHDALAEKAVHRSAYALMLYQHVHPDAAARFKDAMEGRR